MNYRNRDYKLFLKDILEACNNILEHTKNYSCEDFFADKKTIDAVDYNLIVIGEAAKYIPDDIKEKLKDIPFEEIAGLRNRLAHDYLGIDLSIIFAIVEYDIPQLQKTIQKLID